MVELVCEFCGNQYTARKAYSNGDLTKRKYCSVKCSQAGQKKNKNWRDGTFCIKSLKNMNGY